MSGPSDALRAAAEEQMRRRAPDSSPGPKRPRVDGVNGSEEGLSRYNYVASTALLGQVTPVAGLVATCLFNREKQCTREVASLMDKFLESTPLQARDLMPVKVIGRGVVLQLFSTSNLQPTGQLAAQDPTPSEAQPDAAAQAEPDQHRAEPTHAETSAVAPRSLDLATAEATASAACLRLLQAIWQRQHRPPQSCQRLMPVQMLSPLTPPAALHQAAGQLGQAWAGSHAQDMASGVPIRFAVAYNHRGAYGHSLSDAAEGGPAVTTNAQDRLSHVHSLAEGCQSGFQQAGASTQLQVDLHNPQWRNGVPLRCHVSLLLRHHLVLAAEVVPMATGLLCAMCLMDGQCFSNKGKLQVHPLKPLDASA